MALPNWHAALAGAAAGTGKARVACIGDSWTYGYQATAYGENLGLVAALSSLMASAGLPVHQGLFYPSSISVFGIQKRSYTTYGAGWATQPGYGLSPSFAAGAPDGTATSLSIGPFNCDGFIVHYMRRASSFGTFDIDINGGTPVTISGVGSDAQLTTRIDGTYGANTLNVSNVVGGKCVIIAVEPVVGTGDGQGIYVANCGAPSSKATVDQGPSTLATEAVWGTLHSAISVPEVDLSIIMLGINDQNGNKTSAEFTTAMGNIADAALTTGDTLMVVALPYAAAPTYAWSVYQDAIYAVAAARSIPVLDLYGQAGNATIEAAYGGTWDSGDHVHPNDTGHAAMAAAIYGEIVGWAAEARKGTRVTTVTSTPATWTGTSLDTWQTFGAWSGADIYGAVSPGTRIAPEARKGTR